MDTSAWNAAKISRYCIQHFEPKKSFLIVFLFDSRKTIIFEAFRSVQNASTSLLVRVLFWSTFQIAMVKRPQRSHTNWAAKCSASVAIRHQKVMIWLAIWPHAIAKVHMKVLKWHNRIRLNAICWTCLAWFGAMVKMKRTVRMAY